MRTRRVGQIDYVLVNIIDPDVRQEYMEWREIDRDNRTEITTFGG